MGVFFHSFCATDLNFGIKNFGGMKYSSLKTVIFASYWGSPLVQFSKFKIFLWVCWFLCKNLSNFVSLPWKFHNPYCHNGRHISEGIHALIFSWIEFWHVLFSHLFNMYHTSRWMNSPSKYTSREYFHIK